MVSLISPLFVFTSETAGPWVEFVKPLKLFGATSEIFERFRMNLVHLPNSRCSFGNLRKSSVQLRKSSEDFGPPLEIFGSLRVNSVNLRKTEIFRSVRVNFVNLRKTSDQLRKFSDVLWSTSDVFGRLRVYFGKLRVFASGEYNLGLIVLLSSIQNPVILLSAL